MLIKGLIDEDFVNYKKPSMYIAFPTCSWKCGKDLCQNCELALSQNIDINITDVVERYMNNPISEALVCAGLEPFDSWEDLFDLVHEFRQNINDDIVIYTGYYSSEIEAELIQLSKYSNIIIKYGRFIPNQESHYDVVLGVNLASDNQYAEELII